MTIDKPAPAELEPPAEKVVAEEKEFTIKNLLSTNLLSILHASIRMGISRLTVKGSKLTKSTVK